MKRLQCDVIAVMNYVIPYVIISVFLTCPCLGIYVKNTPSDAAPARTPAYFRDDSDVMRYLQMYHTDVMLWRCTNAITMKWTGLPFDYIELNCEVLGKVKSIDLFHNSQKVKFGDRIQLIASPHHTKGGSVFSHWMDFRIRINKATRKDAGSYVVRVKSPLGNRESQMIFLDISKKRHLFDPSENEVTPKQRWRQRMRRRRQRRRRRKRKRARA